MDREYECAFMIGLLEEEKKELELIGQDNWNSKQFNRYCEISEMILDKRVEQKRVKEAKMSDLSSYKKEVDI